MTIRPPFSKSVGLCAGKISMFSKPYFVREMILIFITTPSIQINFFQLSQILIVILQETDIFVIFDLQTFLC